MFDEVLLTAASANFGLRRALVPFLGAAAVFGIQIVAVCAALGPLLMRSPQVHVALQATGAGCLLYLGWRLLRQRSAIRSSAGAFISFGEAAAVQFLNPKAWLMSLAAATLLLPAHWEQVLTGGYTGTI
jgi:threonine/homoserine/homoserine lactone efflux protein